jgi:hypothetical protein
MLLVGGAVLAWAVSVTDAKLNPTPTRIEGASWAAIVVLYSVGVGLVGVAAMGFNSSWRRGFALAAVAWTVLVLGTIWIGLASWQD